VLREKQIPLDPTGGLVLMFLGSAPRAGAILAARAAIFATCFHLERSLRPNRHNAKMQIITDARRRFSR
jgi:hypothetical protein